VPPNSNTLQRGEVAWASESLVNAIMWGFQYPLPLYNYGEECYIAFESTNCIPVVLVVFKKPSSGPAVLGIINSHWNRLCARLL